jgi:23S rRNA (guanosine2251-2'-O)-methyltransferase
MAVVGGLPAALARLRDQGVWSVGLDADAHRSLWDLEAADVPLVLVLGAEGSGLSRLVRQRCDQVVSIPMAGPLESLNAATAGALACFEVARHRGATPTG